MHNPAQNPQPFGVSSAAATFELVPPSGALHLQNIRRRAEALGVELRSLVEIVDALEGRPRGALLAWAELARDVMSTLQRRTDAHLEEHGWPTGSAELG